MGFWTIFWLVWGALLAADFIAAKVGHGSTLSEHIWGRWFPWVWRRCVFLGFWAICGLHLALEGQGWLASGCMVGVWGVSCAAIIVHREIVLRGGEAIVGWLKKVWSGLKKGGTWVLRHGPVVSSAILGASFAFPALKPVAAAIAGLTAGGGQVDGDLAKLIGELFLGVIAMIGVVRKVWAKLPNS
jgi:hypothetical protein